MPFGPLQLSWPQKYTRLSAPTMPSLMRLWYYITLIILNKIVVLKRLGYKCTPAKLNVYVRPAVRSVTPLVLKTCFKFGTRVAYYTIVYHLFVFFFLKSTSLDFWHSLSIYNFALAICPYVGEVQVDSRSECLLESHFNFVCLYVCMCSFIYVPRFNAIADFWFLYLAKFWDILRPGFRSYGCCSDTIAFQNDNVWCNWWR